MYILHVYFFLHSETLSDRVTLVKFQCRKQTLVYEHVPATER